MTVVPRNYNGSAVVTILPCNFVCRQSNTCSTLRALGLGNVLANLIGRQRTLLHLRQDKWSCMSTYYAAHEDERPDRRCRGLSSCARHIIPCSSGHSMVGKPRKALAKAPINLKCAPFAGPGIGRKPGHPQVGTRQSARMCLPHARCECLPRLGLRPLRLQAMSVW